jgi:hypothetical protein
MNREPSGLQSYSGHCGGENSLAAGKNPIINSAILAPIMTFDFFKKARSSAVILRHRTTSWKVAGSILDGVAGIF